MRSPTPIFLSVLFNVGISVATQILTGWGQSAHAHIKQPSTVNPIPSNQPPMLNSSTYNLGSRYITIAHQGNRTCYEGFSVPSGRYAVAVGETTGSLSLENENGSLVIDGWRQYGQTITLRPRGSNLLITNNNGSPQEYNYLSAPHQVSDALNRCLNSPEPFFETAPGYNIPGQSSN